MECNSTTLEGGSIDLFIRIKTEEDMKQKTDVCSSDDSAYHNSNVTVTKEEDLDVGSSPSELVIVENNADINEPIKSEIDAGCMSLTSMKDISPSEIKTEVDIKQEICTDGFDDFETYYDSHIVVTKEEDLDEECHVDEPVLEDGTVYSEELVMSNFECCTGREHICESSTHKDDDVNDDTVCKLISASSVRDDIDSSVCLQSDDKSINRTDNNNITKWHICKVTCLSSQDLSTHMKTHRFSKCHECCFCNNSFLYLDKLRSDERIHTGGKTIKCNFGENYFSCSSHLSTQESIHLDSETYHCSFCEKYFSDYGCLTKHESTHSGSKLYNCESCKRSFTQLRYLKEHKKIHSGIKPHKCSFCEKCFSHSGCLTRHERVHSGSKPYNCKFCAKSFSHSSSLKRHEGTHTGSKPYMCNFCTKSFSDSSNLKSHERIHLGIKPYKCRFCEKSFPRSTSLKNHEGIHLDIKPYKCRFCERLFSNSSNLRRHERTH